MCSDLFLVYAQDLCDIYCQALCLLPGHPQLFKVPHLQSSSALSLDSLLHSPSTACLPDYKQHSTVYMEVTTYMPTQLSMSFYTLAGAAVSHISSTNCRTYLTMSKVSTSNVFDTACFPGPREDEVALHLKLLTPGGVPTAGVATRRLYSSATGELF